MRRLFPLLVIVSFVLATPALIEAQTASTSSISGTVTDPTGAVVPGATVELLDTSTNVSRSTETNAAGQYVFTVVPPGATYRLTVTMQGFRQYVMTALKVETAQSRLVNVTLEVGAIAEVVEVTATAAAELQTSDATVGSVYGGEALLRLPTFNRSVTPIILLQPMVMPGFNVSELVGGQVAGARADQSVFMIDGGDATSDTEGTGGYNTGQSATMQAMIPTPTESIEEFRVGTTNPNATFGRSQGGQIVMTTKRGSNDIHGSAYWYHQNDNLSANSWTNNFSSQPKAEMKDNRWGFSAGGPIVPDRLFIYGHYEGRRFPRKAFTTRRVPTTSLRAGLLVFPDATGVDRTYDIATFDPLSIGISPVMQAYFNAYPVGNFTGTGDLDNTIGFRAPFSNALNSDFAVARLDYNVTDQWTVFGSYRYSRTAVPHTGQIDIAGITCGGAPVCSAGANPLEPRYLVGGVNGQLGPAITNEFRFSWTRHWWFWQRTAPIPLVSGTDIAIQATGEASGALLNDLINFNAQQARDRYWNGKDTLISDNLTWITGRHTLQFGGAFRKNNIRHGRSDKVTGGLTTGRIAQVTDGSFITILPSDRPPTCTGPSDTFCLQSQDVSRWNVLYAAALGLVDNATRVIVADKFFEPQPGQLLNIVDVAVDAWEFYVQDTWRPTPALTISAGLTYQVQIPPEEASGRQSMPIFADSGDPVDFQSYLDQRRLAADQGLTFNPNIGYATPAQITGLRRPTEIDWNNFSPRFAIAWNPSFAEGPLGALFGEGKTVIRAGYSTSFTRMNGVGLVMTPALGPGLSTLVSCGGPDFTGACVGATFSADAFRIGVDGSDVTLPPSPSGIPRVPGAWWTADGELRAFVIDPGMKLGSAHSLNLTWQRELPGNLLMEVGYAGRLGRNLTQSVDLNAMPIFMRDPISGQTLSQAWESIAQELRAGVDPAAVTPQDFYENMLFSGATVLSAIFFTSDYITGFVGDVFIFQDFIFGGLFGITGCSPSTLTLCFINEQSLINSWTTDGGKSQYHAGFVTLRKRLSHGLQFDVNYTYSHSHDHEGLSQQWISGMTNPWDYNTAFTDSIWDRRHVMNVVAYYELPFGSGRAFAPESSVVDKFVGGWFVSSILIAASGLPDCMSGFGNFGGFLGETCAYPTASFVDPGNSINSVVTGSGGIGTNSDPANGGSGMNRFADPEAVFNSFRRPFLTEGRARSNFLHGLPYWNWDLTFGKKTMVTERVGIVFTFDWLNVLNHPQFNSGSTHTLSGRSFGVITSQFNIPRPPLPYSRLIQFGFRVEF